MKNNNTTISRNLFFLERVKKLYMNGKHEFMLIGVLIVLVTGFSIINPRALSVDNMLNILRQMSFIGIMGIGMTFVLISGGIDLSVAAVCGLSGVLTALFLKNGISIFLAIPLVLLVGLSFGLINGLIITKMGVNDFMTTLGTMSVAHGLIFGVTGGYSVYEGITKGFKKIGQGMLGPVPYPTIYLIIFFIIGYILLSKSKLGRQVYAIGGNKKAAFLSGVNIDRIKITVYLISGFLSALTGIILTSRMGSGQANASNTFLFPTVTSVILGGTALAGGEGSMIGTFLGVLVIGILNNGLIMARMTFYWQEIAMGIVLILAISYTSYMKRKSGI